MRIANWNVNSLRARLPKVTIEKSKLLQVLGGDMDWAVGAIWVPGEGGLLRCHLLWHAPGVDAPEFDRLISTVLRVKGVRDVNDQLDVRPTANGARDFEDTPTKTGG